MFAWVRFFLFIVLFHMNTGLYAVEIDQIPPSPLQSIMQTITGSWIFSGLVKNESGDKYGYFFEAQRQDSDFQTKAALIDGQTNQLVFFYEAKEKIEHSTSLDWHVGQSFIRYNPINDSWIFGVKAADKKGFNFKVDMLKQANKENETLVLHPGINLQAIQTSQLNGHVRIDDKEEFVTGNKTWFGKLVLNNEQKESHEINATFCRLTDDNGFYSANLKEKDAMNAAVTGWLDPLGHKVKMSRFISIQALANNQCMLSVGLPKLKLKLINTLNANDPSHAVAGFSKDSRGGFCFVTRQSFLKDNNIMLGSIDVKSKKSGWG